MVLDRVGIESRGEHRGAWLMTLVLATGAVVGCQDEAPPPELPPRAILWESVSGDTASTQRVLSGIVMAVADTTLAFEVGGTVETVEVNQGDFVKRGQVLARLDPEPFELTVRDAEAGLAEATALRESARADAERTTTLYEAEVASRQEYERDVARRDSRESQVDAAQARLSLARRDLRRAVLESPFDGAISVRSVDVSMTVASGQTVFEMDSGEAGLRVEVQMPETLIAEITQGDEVEVTFPSVAGQQSAADDERFEGVVTEVGTRAGTGNAFPVRADLLAPPSGLRPGMTAEVRFSIDIAESRLMAMSGYLVPIAAILAEHDNRFSVFVYDKQSSTVSKRPVRTGGVSDNRIAVVDGLENGDVIATAGVSFLRDGQEVTLLDDRMIRHGR